MWTHPNLIIHLRGSSPRTVTFWGAKTPHLEVWGHNPAHKRVLGLILRIKGNCLWNDLKILNEINTFLGSSTTVCLSFPCYPRLQETHWFVEGWDLLLSLTIRETSMYFLLNLLWLVSRARVMCSEDMILLFGEMVFLSTKGQYCISACLVGYKKRVVFSKPKDKFCYSWLSVTTNSWKRPKEIFIIKAVSV